MWQSSYNGSPSLYLVPTPIGNFEDMTFRAINILRDVSLIFCEDTRVTLQLLNHFSIKNKLVSLHNYNEDKVKDKVLKALKDGYDIAIVSDRGTPLISDPGYKVINHVISHGYNVIALPGACAFVPALIVSSLDINHFLFYGFLNSNKSKKRKELISLKNVLVSIVFYESPHRIYDTLKLIYEVFGNRLISISREISKKYESVFRGTVEQFLKEEQIIKGEIVLIVEGCREVLKNNDDLTLAVNNYVTDGFPLMEAIKKVAKESNMAKSEVYKEYHKNNKEGE